MKSMMKMKHFLYHYIALICYKMLLREHRIHWETTHISDPFHTGATQITEQFLEKYSHFTFIELDKKSVRPNVSTLPRIMFFGIKS